VKIKIYKLPQQESHSDQLYFYPEKREENATDSAGRNKMKE